MLASALSGLALSLSLIVAIGAQNAFVLRQGLRGEHVGPIVLVCALSDAALIFAGVAGLGALVEAAPWIVPLFRYGGAAFLLAYAALAARRAWTGGGALQAGGAATSLRAALGLLLALTWLNPHVYLDTLILMGSVSTQMPDPWAFGAGAAAGSALFFAALGYGARLLRPLFARPVAWRALDAVIAVVMALIGLGLLIGG